MLLPNNIDAIVHIGAGRCQELSGYLANSAKRIILVEPNAQCAGDLRAHSENEPRISILEVAVSNNPDDNQLYEYNLPGADSLYHPTGLKKLFPGLRVLGQQAVRSITGAELLKQCALTGGKNVLVIQAPGAELGIIESLIDGEALDQFCHLALTCAELPLYATPSESTPVLKLLSAHSFDLISKDDTNPDWPTWRLNQNVLKKRLAKLQVEYQSLSKQLKKTQKALNEEKDKTAKLSGELSKLKGTNIIKSCESLEKRLDYLFDQNTLQLEQAANALGRHVTKMAKEIEANIGLHQQVSAEVACLTEQGSRLPASVALQISRQLKAKQYDAIIEFGSGLTTSFMAQMLRDQPTSETSARTGGPGCEEDSGEASQLKPIICFEHDRVRYLNQQQALNSSGLAPLINLQLSPLVPCNLQEKEYLFYDCTHSIEGVSQLVQGRKANIFILVNDTDDDQVEPLMALPLVLTHLSDHTLNVLINVQDRKRVLDQWKDLLNERGTHYVSVYGAGHEEQLTINP